MSAMASQISGVSVVYSTVCSGADQGKHQSSASLALCEGNSPVTVEFPAQRASNAENVPIWWRHHTPATMRHVAVVDYNSRTLSLIVHKPIAPGRSEYVHYLKKNKKNPQKTQFSVLFYADGSNCDNLSVRHLRISCPHISVRLVKHSIMWHCRADIGPMLPSIAQRTTSVFAGFTA